MKDKRPPPGSYNQERTMVVRNPEFADDEPTAPPRPPLPMVPPIAPMPHRRVGGAAANPPPPSSASGRRPTPAPIAFKPYVFQNLPKVSRQEMLLFERLEWLLPAEGATKRTGDSIRKRLKELFEEEVKLFVDHVEVQSPDALHKIVPTPSYFAVMAPAPHKTRGICEVELGLAHAAIDLLLGGAGESIALRALTDIEEGVIEFVLLEALRTLAPNIEPGLPRLRLEGSLKSAEEALGVLEGEPHVVVVTLKGLLGTKAGFVRLFIPATMLGMTNPPEDGPERKHRRLALIKEHSGRLAGVKTWLRAEIGRAEVSARDLSTLQVGDVVLADEVSAKPHKHQGGTAKLRVGLGRTGRMDADIVVTDGRYHAKITGFVLGGDPRLSSDADEAEEAAGADEQEGEEELPEGGVIEEEDGEFQTAHGEEGESSESTNPSGRYEGKHVDESQKGSEGADLLNDIPLQLAVELARVPFSAEQVIALRVGQVIDLNRVPGEPVDLSVNGKIVARGEMVEVEGHLGVRILSMAG